jgi:deazaflavin-dependent oxidoreductase (nitroreductase family)
VAIARRVDPVVRRLVDVGLVGPLPGGIGPVVLESVGRRTSRARRTPVLALWLGPVMVVTTSRRRSDWFANLESEPRARVQVWGRHRDVRATTQRGPVNVDALRCGDSTRGRAGVA